jgi:glyoxylase-like metal-dependent hydrolase (beta-lactamase superfamily II)
MSEMTKTLRMIEAGPGVYAYYDGRIDGKRLHSPRRNWLDDGAYGLGIASYAIVSGVHALVYDTHISLDHARAVRTHLEGLGVTRIEVVLSHWHTDHVAGNAVFADFTMIANVRTALALVENETLLSVKDPPIAPLILPNRLYDGRLDLKVGDRRVELLEFDIHSADGTVLHLPDEGLLLAGDTVEDTVTYIAEPAGIDRHIRELDRLAGLPFARILPNHGRVEQIGVGGYGAGLIEANRRYLQRLSARIDEPDLAREPLSIFVAGEIAEGWISHYPAYEQVHRDNIESLRQSKRRVEKDASGG